MTYTIKMMGGDTFNISEDTFKKLAGQTGLIHLKEIDGIINLNSVTSIFPEGLIKKEITQVKLNDGTIAVKIFGIWYNQNNPEAKIDLNYYPVLKTEESIKAFLDEKESIKKLTD